jgi:hypothetical protein
MSSTAIWSLSITASLMTLGPASLISPSQGMTFGKLWTPSSLASRSLKRNLALDAISSGIQGRFPHMLEEIAAEEHAVDTYLGSALASALPPSRFIHTFLASMLQSDLCMILVGILPLPWIIHLAASDDLRLFLVLRKT